MYLILYYVEGMFKYLSQKILSGQNEIRSFPVQSLSLILWSCATLKLSDPTTVQLFHQIARELRTQDLDRFKPQELTNLIWAYATLKISCDNLIQIIISEIIRGNIHDYSDSSPCSVTHSFRELKSFSRQEFATLLWSLATLRSLTPPNAQTPPTKGSETAYEKLWDKLNIVVGNEIIMRRNKFELFQISELCTIAWACSGLGSLLRSYLLSFSLSVSRCLL